MKYFMGLDTSCYTTSVAILDDTGSLIADKRKILEVKNGARGMAQSEMVFQHTRNLPNLIEQLYLELNSPIELAAIGVSAFPRSQPNSYMPAFLVGEGYGRALAAARGIHLYRLSHQESHIQAGVWSAGGPTQSRFLAVHASGGTTEIVLVDRENDNSKFTLLGGSEDLNAGQFVDRVGVALHLPFPAGRHLEALALNHHHDAFIVPVSVKGLKASFSGPASHVLRMVAKGADREAIAAGVEICIAHSLARLIRAATEQTGIYDVLLVGGVLSNAFIRQTISQEVSADKIKLYYPDRQYSPDNAVGAAYFAFLTGTSGKPLAYDT